MTATDDRTQTELEPQTREELHELMRRLATVKSRIAENEATAEADRKEALGRIAGWLERETASDRSYAVLLEAQAAGYLLAHLDELRGKRSISTPWGDVCSTAQQPEYRRDETSLMAWAAEQGYIRTKTTEEVDWKRIKDACHVVGNRLVTSDGEVVPGVEIVDRQPKVEVKAS